MKTQLLSFKKIGHGDKILLFLHELMGDCTNYELSSLYFNTDLFTCYLIDLRGYGLSKNIKGTYDLNESISDIINFLNYYNISSCSLIAHSMSTMIAQHIALKDKRIKNLILITPISYFGVKSTIKAKNNILSQMENGFKIEEIVEQSSARFNNIWKKERISLAHNCSLKEARIGYMNMYLNDNFDNEYNDEFSLDVNTKIITGKYDFPVFSYSQVSKIFKNFRNIQIVECQESGHYPMIECPIYFASKIEEWCK